MKPQNFLGCLVFITVVLVGCASPAPDIATQTPAPTLTSMASPQPSETPTQAPSPTMAVDTWAEVDPTGQTITYWHNFTRSRAETLNGFINSFNETNPYGIVVEGVNKGPLNEVFDATQLVLGTGEAPNLVVGYQNNSAAYLDQSPASVLDLSSLMTSESWGFTEEERADITQPFLAGDQFNGGQYGLSPNRSMAVMYYNADWLDQLGYSEPPGTPEAFRETACSAVENPYFTTPPIGYAVHTEASILASWAFAFGGDIYDRETAKYTYDSPQVIEAARFLQSLVEEGCATLITEAFADQDAFTAGQALFTVGTSAGIPFYDSAATFEWSVAAVPHSTPDPVQNVYGPSVIILHSTPEQELASWLFLKYLIQPEILVEWSTATAYFPLTSSAAEQLTDYRATYPPYDAALKLAEYGKAEPATANYEQVRSLVSDAMLAVLRGEDAEEILSNLNIAANAITF